MSTYFNESVAHRASPESDHYGIIMEVSNPISEEPAYGDPTSWQWCGAVEEGETSCPTATLEITKQWRQKQTTPVVAVSEKVKERNLTSSPGCTIKGAPVPTRFQQGAPVPDSSTKGAPVPTRFQQGAPVPDSSTKGAPVPTRFQQGAPVLVSSTLEPSTQVPRNVEESIGQCRQKLKIHEPLRRELLQKKPYACYLQGAPMPDRCTKGAPMPTRFQQGAPVLVSSTLEPSTQVPGNVEESIGQCRQKLKIREPLRRELLQKKPYARFLQGAPVPDISTKGAPMPTRFQQGAPVLVSSTLEPSTQVPGNVAESIGQYRQKLKIREPLRRELLQKKPYARFLQGAPMPDSSTKGAPMPTRFQQGAPVLVSSTLEPSTQVPGNVEESIGQCRQKLKIREPLRRELLQKKPYACFLQGAPVPIPERKKLIISKPLRQPLATTLLNSTPMGAPVHIRTPREAAVPARSSQAAAVPAESAAFPAWKILRGRRRLENLRENLLI